MRATVVARRDDERNYIRDGCVTTKQNRFVANDDDDNNNNNSNNNDVAAAEARVSYYYFFKNRHAYDLFTYISI